MLWIFAVATYGVGDTATTYISLGHGSGELNPLINQYTIIPLKILIFIFLLMLSKKIPEKTFTPLLLTLLGVIGILRNIYILIEFI